MDTCDVVIVGGGPAGSSCAWALRDSGLDVLIVDRAAFPRNKLCAGWITPLILDELEFTPDDYPPSLTIQPITGFRLGAIGGPQVEIRGRSRRQLRHSPLRVRRIPIAKKRSAPARRLGAHINRTQGRRLAHQRRNPRPHGSSGPEGTSAPSGAISAIKALLRQSWRRKSNSRWIAPQAGGSKVDPELPELFFCRDMVGYGWVFRKGDYLNVGLGRTDSHEISRHVKEFVGYLQETRGVETPATGIAGHAYGLWGRIDRKILDDGVLLVGDAAGLAYPESGEGIRPAIESGLIAAHAITSADGNYCAKNLSLYRELLNARLQRERSRMDSLTQSLPHVVKEFLGRQLLRNRSFCQNVVDEPVVLACRRTAA